MSELLPVTKADWIYLEKHLIKDTKDKAIVEIIEFLMNTDFTKNGGYKYSVPDFVAYSITKPTIGNENDKIEQYLNFTNSLLTKFHFLFRKYFR